MKNAHGWSTLQVCQSKGWVFFDAWVPRVVSCAQIHRCVVLYMPFCSWAVQLQMTVVLCCVKVEQNTTKQNDWTWFKRLLIIKKYNWKKVILGFYISCVVSQYFMIFDIVKVCSNNHTSSSKLCVSKDWEAQSQGLMESMLANFWLRSWD